MTEPLISIIMPVYNAEKYLKDSLGSIFSQTFTDFEVICIDDGSKDDSLALLKEMKDKRLKIVHQENQGVSATRNNGIKLAKGKYLTFIDSDDLWHPTFLEKMKKAAENTQALVTGCGYSVITQTPQTITPVLSKSPYVQKRPFLRYLLGRLDTHAMVWGKLYQKSVLKDLSFDPDLQYGEDTHFSMQLFSGLKEITCLKEKLYLYRLSENSLTRSGMKTMIIDNRLISFRKLIDFFNKSDCSFLEKWLIKRKLAKRYYRSVCKLPWKKDKKMAPKIWENYIEISKRDIAEKTLNLNYLNLYYRFLFWLWREKHWDLLKIFL